MIETGTNATLSPVPAMRTPSSPAEEKVSAERGTLVEGTDRKSTRLNSSHGYISYAVFCLNKKNTRLNSSHGDILYAAFCLKNKLPLFGPLAGVTAHALTLCPSFP